MSKAIPHRLYSSPRENEKEEEGSKKTEQKGGYFDKFHLLKRATEYKEELQKQIKTTKDIIKGFQEKMEQEKKNIQEINTANSKELKDKMERATILFPDDSKEQVGEIDAIQEIINGVQKERKEKNEALLQLQEAEHLGAAQDAAKSANDESKKIIVKDIEELEKKLGEQKERLKLNEKELEKKLEHSKETLQASIKQLKIKISEQKEPLAKLRFKLFSTYGFIIFLRFWIGAGMLISGFLALKIFTPIYAFSTAFLARAKHIQTDAVEQEFFKGQNQLTQEQVTESNLLIGQNGQNKQRVLDFICNTHWNLPATLNSLKQERKNLKEGKTKNVILFAGDPGIGKSSAFCSIIYHLNKNQATKTIIREKFPFFEKGDQFIYIHASPTGFNHADQQNERIVLNYLSSNQCSVVIDDAHFLKPTQRGLEFINRVKANAKWVILLSSQNIRLKDNTKRYNLTELPHNLAIEQIVQCFKTTCSLRKITPPNQTDYFAYRMWYYIGGNMRILKTDIFNFGQNTHSGFFDLADTIVSLERVLSWESPKIDLQSIETPEQLNKVKANPFKRVFYKSLVKYLNEDCNKSLQEIIDLKFQFVPDRQKDSTPDFYEIKNILVTKMYERVNDQPTVFFHSRRVHYAFSRWILTHYQKIEMKEGSPTREEFMQVLERVEYKYILSFEVYSLKQTIKKTNPDFKDVEEEKAAKRSMTSEDITAAIKEQNKQESKSTDQRKEETIQSSPDEEIENESDDQSVIEIAKGEKEIIMKLYEAYQAQNQKNHSFEPEFTPKPIMRDLVKGEEHFMKVKGFDTSKVKQEEIAKIKEQIDKRMKKDGVAKRRAKLYKTLADEFLKEFEKEEGFDIQSKQR